MNEITGAYGLIMAIVGIGLTITAVYSALNMFLLIKTSKHNKTLLFLGGTFLMGIGNWIMNFMELYSIDINRFSHDQIPIALLSFLIGLTFTGVAFFSMTGNFIRFPQLLFSGLLLTLAVLSEHIVGIYAMNFNINYNTVLFIFSCLLIFGSFMFSLWRLFYNTRFSSRHQKLLKLFCTLLITGVIIEADLIFNEPKLNLVTEPISSMTSAVPTSFVVYLIIIVSILILTSLISSRAIISKRLIVFDMNLKDINSALDETNIVTISDAFGKITYVNDKFEAISKYKWKEIIGSDHRILDSGYHTKEFFKSLWKAIQSGEIWRGEIRNIAKDGKVYWVDTTIVPFLDKWGKPEQFITIQTDISDRKIAEEHLKDTLKENNDIKFALDQSSIVAFTDARGIITSVNDTFCKISKYDRSELIGKSHGILNSGYHSNEFFKTLWKTIMAGNVWKGEIRNKAKDGTLYWVDTTIVPFLDKHGEPYQYLAIRNDISERKRTEEILHRQDKLAAVGQLAAGVAHEIRNPLTSIKGYAEFLQLDEQDPNRLEFFNIILEEIERVNMIVEDFMVLAKPKAVILEEQNVVPVIQNVVSLLAFDARKKNVRLHFDCHQEIIQIECDENRLKQVFLNFIKNGIEAMPNGGDIHVRVNIQEENVQISIQDTGMGIPEDKLKKLGEPFYTTKKNGNGLGLMVSFKIIESHNGKVYVESEPNKGTTFNILLPAKTA